jgi:hypothetical protein
MFQLSLLLAYSSDLPVATALFALPRLLPHHQGLQADQVTTTAASREEEASQVDNSSPTKAWTMMGSPTLSPVQGSHQSRHCNSPKWAKWGPIRGMGDTTVARQKTIIVAAWHCSSPYCSTELARAKFGLM